MSRPTVGTIGALIVVAFILTTIAVFTKGWIVFTVSYFGVKASEGVGIVPYRSNEVTWFAAASWLMFISFGLFFPLFVVYLHAGYKVHRHGCCHSIRHSFHGISLLASLITIMQAVAFILVAVNCTHYSAYASEQLGFSAYLALVSAIFTTIAMSLSGFLLF
ncbi:unnamed protein product [Caenorhabditis sp. 36 PRJEB53466]|nr:unnamed protein product [Caenorhabditis sp. 36 PRJEB53466]